MSKALYDTIGRTYAMTRREDPKIASQIRAALGDARNLLNVGAGTGNYEPSDLDVVALEPSSVMIRQRQDRSLRVLQGIAESLPFADGSFDVSMAVLTMHHWTEVEIGLIEMQRVSERQVILYFEPLQLGEFWMLEYFPAALGVASERRAPGAAEIHSCLDVVEVAPIEIPRDCRDGFALGFWARPERYLDPDVQAGMSCLAKLSAAERREGSARLANDLASGVWDRNFGELRELPSLDLGYRLALAGGQLATGCSSR